MQLLVNSVLNLKDNNSAESIDFLKSKLISYFHSF